MCKDYDRSVYFSVSVHMVEIMRCPDAVTNHGFEWTIGKTWLRNNRSTDACRVETKEGASQVLRKQQYKAFVMNGNFSRNSVERSVESYPVTSFGKPISTAVVLTPRHDGAVRGQCDQPKQGG